MLATINRKLTSYNRATVLSAVLFVSYFIFQLMYIPYSKLSVDEFWFAHHIYQYTQNLPYRDFPPYKTVLGYYLLTLPFYFSHAILTPLYLVKIEIALLNSALFFTLFFWLKRWCSPRALLITFALLMANQLFLVYSVDLRVDMLASWFCLFSALFVLNRQAFLGGISLAIGFLISQKTLWYFVATNGAYAASWLVANRNIETIKATLRFNSAVVLLIGIYIAAWSYVSSLQNVLYSVFYEAYLQSKITWFAAHTLIFWQEMLTNGPLLYALWPMTWLSLWIEPGNKQSRIFIFIYTSIVMLLVLTYKQSFPYNMVFSVPIFILMYAYFFTWLLQFANSKPVLSKETAKKLFWFLTLYGIGLISTMIIFDLPLAYYGMLSIPVFFYYAIAKKHPENSHAMLITCLFMTIFITGIFYPLVRFTLVSTILDGRYQKSMILVSSQLLSANEGYVAGTPLFYDRDQPIPGLKNLIGPAIEYLQTGNKSLEPILLPSLYLTATTPAKIIASFQQHPIKLYVDGYRIASLPLPLIRYLHSHYLHYWGSIFLYAPLLKKGDKLVELQFSGHYKMSPYSAGTVRIDKHFVMANQIIPLNTGIHTLETDVNFRLQLMPDSKLTLNPKFSKNAWEEMSKFIVL